MTAKHQDINKPSRCNDKAVTLACQNASRDDAGIADLYVRSNLFGIYEDNVGAENQNGETVSNVAHYLTTIKITNCIM